MAGISEEWVEIWDHNPPRPSYYFNRRTQVTQMKHVETVWAGLETEPSCGKFYWWKKGSAEAAIWQLPDLDPSAIEADTVCSETECDPSCFSEPGNIDQLETDDAWVKVEDGVTNFWNFKLGVSMHTLPTGKLSTKTAYRSQNFSKWYYLDSSSGTTSWELPGRRAVTSNQEMSAALSLSQAKWLYVGAPVCVIGLRKQPRFNNQLGILVDATPERFLVRLPEEHFGILLLLRPENLQPLPGGSLVELFGLSQPAFNGVMGTVQCALPNGQSEVLRYVVKLADGSEKSLRAANLKPRSRLWDIGIAIVRKSTALQWRDEQSCLFVDSQGHHRHYSLHLPLGFDLLKPSSSGEEVMKWPLLVYMHGTGGGTFFTHSKKSLKTPGMQFAARTFIVITPRCEWTWRDSPSQWVMELIQAFRVLECLDHRRIYLTGLSMGGMGAWEVAAQRPELFAALSPVAAHHKKENEVGIAQRLSRTPVFAVHDGTDETCPIGPEARLWDLIQDNGNTDLQTLLTSGVDHCKIHEHAYCISEDLYHWFLKRSW